MKISKEHLRRIVQEACGDLEPIHDIPEMPVNMGVPVEEYSAEPPCPYSTADSLRNSGMDSEAILNWVHTLLGTLLEQEEMFYDGQEY